MSTISIVGARLNKKSKLDFVVLGMQIFLVVGIAVLIGTAIVRDVEAPNSLVWILALYVVVRAVFFDSRPSRSESVTRPEEGGEADG